MGGVGVWLCTLTQLESVGGVEWEPPRSRESLVTKASHRHFPCPSQRRLQDVSESGLSSAVDA